MLLAGVLCCREPVEPAKPQVCQDGDGALARFDITLGDLSLTELDEKAVPCSIVEIGATLRLECRDSSDLPHEVDIALMGKPEIHIPATIGENVLFQLRFDGGAASDAGAWVVRRESGDLLLAGLHSRTPLSDAITELFAPLVISVELELCSVAINDCTDSSRLLMRFEDDSLNFALVASGDTAVLVDAYRIQIEDAIEVRRSKDASCPDPPPSASHRFFIVALR